MNRSIFRFMLLVLVLFTLAGCVSANEMNEVQSELAAANSMLAEYKEQHDILQNQLTELQKEISEKNLRIAELEQNIVILTDDGIAADDREVVLFEQIQQLRTSVEKYAAQIEELQTFIDTYENITSIDFSEQANRISDLLLKMTETMRPTKTEVIETENENGELVSEETQTPGKVSFYYQDLTTGYTLSYNPDEIMYSASLIKLPYVYSMLKSIAKFEEQKLLYDSNGNPLYDADGVPLFEGKHPNLDDDGNIIYLEGEERFDLSRIWTYDQETMNESGSGILQEEESGFQLTYLELVRYALQYSDNIAFAQLRKMFGYTEYYAETYRLGIRGTSSGFMQLTASDCSKFLSAAYSFIDENEKYGTLMRDALVHSNYPVMIPAGIPSVPCAHKYGWDTDAYHDMAIVYDEHPYVLVIMTDLDQGGNAVNAYIQDIARSIHKIHRAFYHS